MQLLIPRSIDFKNKYFIVVTVKKTSGVNLILKYKTSLSDNYRVFQANCINKEEIN